MPPFAPPLAPSSSSTPPLVSLVGAGPGDPELITVRGLKRVQQADVILTDSLVHPDLLAFARPDADIVDVGKIPGGPQTPQDVTNRLLVDEAKQGKRVVRLKGGDAFVFGRGSEEALVCAAAGICVEVVPGVTSSVAGPATALVPVTHRGVSTHFTVITGRGGPSHDKLPDRWRHLAKAGGTLVFLMSIKSLPDIQRGLLDAGVAPNMKAALIERATWESERVLFTTVDEMVNVVRDEQVRPPAIVVVGDVVGIGEELNAMLSFLPTSDAAADAAAVPAPLSA